MKKLLLMTAALLALATPANAGQYDHLSGKDRDTLIGAAAWALYYQRCGGRVSLAQWQSQVLYEFDSEVAGLSRIMKQKGVTCAQIKAMYPHVQEAARPVLAGEERRKQERAERQFAEWKAQQEEASKAEPKRHDQEAPKPKEEAAPAKPGEKVPPPAPRPGEAVSKEFFEYIYPEMAFECGQEIKRFVKYDIRSPGLMWGHNSGSDPMFLLRMSRWSTRVAPDNTILLAGDDAEAQNGFGNWMRVNYTCTVDLASKTVKRATMSEGRLQ
jgi:hypothetical protein